MQAILNQARSLFLPDLKFNEEATTKNLALKTLRAGFCFGSLIAPISAYALTKFSPKNYNAALFTGAVIFAGCIVIASVVAIVKVINFQRFYRDLEVNVNPEVNHYIQEGKKITESARKERRETALNKFKTELVTALESWNKEANINDFINLCSEKLPMHITGNNESNAEIVICNKAFIEILDEALEYYSKKNDVENIKKIYEVSIEIGYRYFKLGQKFNMDDPIIGKFYYNAAANWFHSPAKIFHFSDQTALSSKFIKATSLYWYMIVTNKIEIDYPDEQINTVTDSLHKAVELGNPLACYAEACWKVDKRRLESDEDSIEPEFLEQALATFLHLGGKAEIYEGIRVSELARTEYQRKRTA